MGFFSFFFGSSSRLSAVERPLSEIEIKRLVSSARVRSLSQNEMLAVEQAVIARRRGDGKISLRQIDEVLRSLQNQGRISKVDRKGVLRVFADYFDRFR